MPPGRTLREALGLLRLLLSPSRHRADRVYALLGDHNHLGRDAMWLNLGYWARARTYDEAGEALARLLGERADLGVGQRVLDVGFGFGDGPMLWADTWQCLVSGLNVSPGQVAVARRRASERGLWIDLREGSATKIPFADGYFDRVLALESAFHFAPRAAFFAEARRVLRPGGRLATADYVPRSADPPRGWRARLSTAVGRALWQIPRENMVPADVYAAQLREAGFTAVRVESIREHVFAPFRAYARRRQAEPEVAARAHPLLRAAWRASRSPHDAMDYVIATAS